MMSSDLCETCRHCLYGTLSHLRGCNCNPFGNVATVTSQLLLHHARHCIGHNGKYLNLGTLEKLQTSENFPKNIFVQICFFHKISF